MVINFDMPSKQRAVTWFRRHIKKIFQLVLFRSHIFSKETIMKSVVITGANKGIGLALCRKFAFDLGFKVYLCGRTQEKCDRAVKELDHPNIIPLLMDVAEEQSISEAYQNYLSLRSPDEQLYAFINNAASNADWIPNVSHIKSLEIDMPILMSMYKTNVFSSILTLRYFMPSMVQGCRVVNVTSGSGEFWDANAMIDFQIGYAPTKSALIMTTKKLAAAVIDHHIYVNSCCPGWCRTDKGGWNADCSSDDGADSILAACFLDSEMPPTGGHWRYGQRIPIDILPQNMTNPYKDYFFDILTSISNFKNSGIFQYLARKINTSCHHKEIETIFKSRLFDNIFYYSEYNDVKESKVDPLKHYVLYGATEGRNPNTWFNTLQYLELNQDVKASGMNPFYHFLQFGIAEGRKLFTTI